LEQTVHEVTGEYAQEAAVSWRDMVTSFKIENTQVEPSVTLIANDNWLEYTVRYVVDYKNRRRTKDRLFTRILEEVDRSHGKIVLASATFELVGAPPITIQKPRAQKRQSTT
jgi:hypothetical protein